MKKLTILLLTIFLASNVYSQSFEAHLNNATKNKNEKNYTQTIENLRKAILAVWDETPLTITKIFL